MDKYEYKVRSEEISKLIDKEKYAEAVKIADTIDWRRVKSASMLLKIAALYRVNRRNEDSRAMLALAYERYPTNRSVVYSLCEVSIELDDVVAAIEYYKQFVKLAPKDNGVFTLRYRILEISEASLEERIDVLEELKKRDYQEEWGYELAYLYHRVGLSTKCVEECDEIILWFGDGPYVMKAMELKMLHKPLTQVQKAKYDSMKGSQEDDYEQEFYAQSQDSQDAYQAEDYTQEAYNQESYDAQAYENGTYDTEVYKAEAYEPETYGNEAYGTENYAASSYEAEESYYQNTGFDSAGTEGYDPDSGYTQTDYSQEQYNNIEYGIQSGYSDEAYANGEYSQQQYAEEGYSQNSYQEDTYEEQGYIQTGYSQEQYMDQTYDTQAGYSGSSYENDTTDGYSGDLYNSEAFGQAPYTENGYLEEAYGQDASGRDGGYEQQSSDNQYYNRDSYANNTSYEEEEYHQETYGQYTQDTFVDDGYGNFCYTDNTYQDPGYTGEFYIEQTYDAGGEPGQEGYIKESGADSASVLEVQNSAAAAPGSASAASSDMSQYNTINLQKVVAESMKELFPDDDAFEEEQKRLNAEEIAEGSTASQTIIYGNRAEWESSITTGKMAQMVEGVSETAPEPHTGAIKKVMVPGSDARYLKDEQDMETLRHTTEKEVSEEHDRIEHNAENVYHEKSILDVTSITGEIPKPVTGQMRIHEVLEEWERKKTDNARKFQEEIKRHVLTRTGKIFADFDNSIKSGILGELAREEEKDSKRSSDKFLEADVTMDIPQEKSVEFVGNASDAAAVSSELEALPGEHGLSGKQVPAEIASSGLAEKPGMDADTGEKGCETDNVSDKRKAQLEQATESSPIGTQETDAGGCDRQEEAVSDKAEHTDQGEAAISGDTEPDRSYESRDMGMEETAILGHIESNMPYKARDTRPEETAILHPVESGSPYMTEGTGVAETPEPRYRKTDKNYEPRYTGLEETMILGHIELERPCKAGSAELSENVNRNSEKADYGSRQSSAGRGSNTPGKQANSLPGSSSMQERPVYYRDENAVQYARNTAYTDDELDDLETYTEEEQQERMLRKGTSSGELDPEEVESIAEMAKQDALKTQEIKMNTADLSALSEKIVATTKKEATGAKREQIRDFTEEEQALFENFAVTNKIKKQIIYALDNMTLAAYTGNVIITGDAGLDTVRMAKNLVKEYQGIDSSFSGKAAKITGEKLNQRDLKEVFAKLNYGGIIIEKANGMSEEKLYEMTLLLNQDNLEIIVIMEDTKKEINKLLQKQAMIADYFNIRIDLMEMDNNALVAYARNYALALEYSIDELGTLALYTRISNMQSGNHVVTKDEVRDIIDEAIWKSKKSKLKNFVDVLFARRYDNEDMIVLKERDFI